jgi:hypothetical protein
MLKVVVHAHVILEVVFRVVVVLVVVVAHDVVVVVCACVVRGSVIERGKANSDSGLKFVDHIHIVVEMVVHDVAAVYIDASVDVEV